MEITSHKNGYLPVYQPGSGGCDVKFHSPDNTKAVISPKCTVVINCGFSVNIPDGYKLVLMLKDFMVDKCISLGSNVFVGERDANVRLHGYGKEIMVLDPGQVFATMYLEPILEYEFKVN